MEDSEVSRVPEGNHAKPLTTEAEPSAATWANPVWHRGYRIYLTDPVPPIPTWREFEFSFTHDDYDGPEDNRHGYAATVEACKREIDAQEDD